MRFISIAVIAVVAAALAAAPAQAMQERGPFVEPNTAGFDRSDAAQTGGTAVESRAAAAETTLPGPPTWPESPQPISPSRTAQPAGDDGMPWDTIAFGLAAAALVLTAAGGLVGMRRRSQSARAAA